MSESDHSHRQLGNVIDNPWRRLREFTDARIGLGRAGISLPTSELLAFQLSHAQARDAVHFPLDVSALRAELQALQGMSADTPLLHLLSQATDRVTYLQRPDLGRKLDDASRQQVVALPAAANATPSDLAIVIVDGLSSLAVQQNAAPFLAELLPLLQSQQQLWSLAPLTVVEQGRVAIGDDIGELINARMVLLLIGERPGLSSPDSLGLYLTWNPRSGLNDAARNCISNVRPAGLAYAEAARRVVYLMNEARRLQLSGVNLKDRTRDSVLEQDGKSSHFLIADQATAPK
ncbi:ethanolamine ammonia-lyase subunit EutC [uncultured Halopseudomonas sp.]|uniref:ethanolamine ammonia-lyase subunit EutC n=1 Tax=uncultured Halopseudomonas sp. TaxID=2901193 RepID=UPI0030ED07B0|tara:strand:- start:4702 stop:5571 length:870 start_codon:yes stop_codon:yes gene_type:complete